MTIRLATATAADEAAAVDLIHALNVFEKSIVPDRRGDRAAAVDCYRRLRERVARQDGRIVLAFDRDHHPVGLMGFVFAEDEPFVRSSLRLYGLVTELVVAEEARGRGIGRALLAEAERLTRERGAKRLFIGVLDANVSARAAYEAAGFTDYMRTMIKPLD
jgi:GNAT superfamily N-acetyltransferase